jgi:hypothetical protein
MTQSETELALSLLAYVLAAGASLVIGYLAWRKIRPHRGHYQCLREREEQRKRAWGWE